MGAQYEKPFLSHAGSGNDCRSDRGLCPTRQSAYRLTALSVSAAELVHDTFLDIKGRHGIIAKQRTYKSKFTNYDKSNEIPMVMCLCAKKPQWGERGSKSVAHQCSSYNSGQKLRFSRADTYHSWHYPTFPSNVVTPLLL